MCAYRGSSIIAKLGFPEIEFSFGAIASSFLGFEGSRSSQADAIRIVSAIEAKMLPSFNFLFIIVFPLTYCILYVLSILKIQSLIQFFYQNDYYFKK
jgi:hypothetical protein